MLEDVVFLADCISNRKTLDKYVVSFIYDVSAYLNKVKQMKVSMYVPAHAEASADVKELVSYNKKKVQSIEERILSVCEEPVCFEPILQEVFKG